MAKAKFRITSVLSRAFEIYKEDFSFMLVNGALATALMNVSAFLSVYKLEPLSNFIKLIGLITYIIALVGVTNRVNLSFNKAPAGAVSPDYGDKVFRIIASAMIYNILTLCGLILLAAPGIYFGVTFAFSITASIIEDDAISPFKMSKEVVRGYFWKVCLIITLAMLVMFTPGAITAGFFGGFDLPVEMLIYAILIVIDIILWPFAVVLIVESYLELRKINRRRIKTDKMESIGQGMGCAIALLLAAALMITSIVVKDKAAEWLPGLNSDIKRGVFENGITLKTGGGWKPIANVLEKNAFTLEKGGNKLIFKSAVSFYSRELSEMAADPDDRALLVNKVYSYLVDKYSTDKVKSMIKLDRLNFAGDSTMTIAGREWVKAELFNNRSSDKGEFTLKWVILFTFYKNDIVIVDYFYKMPGLYDKKTPIPEKVLKDEQELYDYIGTIKVPED